MISEEHEEEQSNKEHKTAKHCAAKEHAGEYPGAQTFKIDDLPQVLSPLHHLVIFLNSIGFARFRVHRMAPPSLLAQQVGECSNVRGNPSCLIFRQQLRR